MEQETSVGWLDVYFGFQSTIFLFNRPFLNELENDVKMTSKRHSNKINLLSLSFVTKCLLNRTIHSQIQL